VSAIHTFASNYCKGTFISLLSPRLTLSNLTSVDLILISSELNGCSDSVLVYHSCHLSEWSRSCSAIYCIL